MSLQGSIPDFTVADVLQLLGLARRTGVLRFSGGQGSGARSGAIYLRDGRAVGAEADGLAGEPAVEVLCSWESGGFVFREGATSPRENLDVPAEALARRAGAALGEWKELRQLLPAPTAPIRPAATLPEGVEEVRLDREEWCLVARMSRPETLSAWTQQAGGGLHAHRVVRSLVEKGLIDVSP